MPMRMLGSRRKGFRNKAFVYGSMLDDNDGSNAQRFESPSQGNADVENNFETPPSFFQGRLKKHSDVKKTGKRRNGIGGGARKEKKNEVEVTSSDPDRNVPSKLESFFTDGGGGSGGPARGAVIMNETVDTTLEVSHMGSVLSSFSSHLRQNEMNDDRDHEQTFSGSNSVGNQTARTNNSNTALSVISASNSVGNQTARTNNSNTALSVISASNSVGNHTARTNNSNTALSVISGTNSLGNHTARTNNSNHTARTNNSNHTARTNNSNHTARTNNSNTAASTTSVKSGSSHGSRNSFFKKFRRKTKKHNGHQHTALDSDHDGIGGSDHDAVMMDSERPPVASSARTKYNYIGTPSTTTTTPATPFTDGSEDHDMYTHDPHSPAAFNQIWSETDSPDVPVRKKMMFPEEEDAGTYFTNGPNDYGDEYNYHADGKETSFRGDHSKIWETDPDPDERETGLQIEGLEMDIDMDAEKSVTSEYTKSSAQLNIPPSGVDSDGFFTADFNFSVAINSQLDEEESVFPSFDNGIHWKPVSNDFGSFELSKSSNMGANNESGDDHIENNNRASKSSGKVEGTRKLEDDSEAELDVENYVYPSSLDYGSHKGDFASVYSAPSPQRKYDDHDERHLLNESFEGEPTGPIDVDTQQKWKPNDPGIVRSGTKTKDKGTNVLQALDTNDPGYKPSYPSAPRSSTPIDIDTGEPWTPELEAAWNNEKNYTHYQFDEVKRQEETSRVDAYISTDDESLDSSLNDARSIDDDEKELSFDDNDLSFDVKEFEETHDLPATPNAFAASVPRTPQAPIKKAGSASLTLGVLAQISGLVDFHETKTERYGKTYVEKDDDLSAEDDAVSKASKPYLEENENSLPRGESGHLVPVVNFHEDGKTMEVVNPELHSEIAVSAVSSSPTIEKENSGSQDYSPHAGKPALESPHVHNSPFQIDLSKIHNQSHHNIDQVEIDMDEGEGIGTNGNLAAPRILEDVFDSAGSDGMDTVEAELEMEELVQKMNIAKTNTQEEPPLPPSKKEIEPTPSAALESENVSNDTNEEPTISFVKEFWKQKEHKVTSIKTDPISTKKARGPGVEWPDAPVAAAAGKKDESAFGDDFFSRTKKKKPKKKPLWDVPTSVTTTAQSEPSFATEMSSMCDSFDMTEDGFQVPKRKSAKEAYRATATSTRVSSKSNENAEESSKGFFWRSHPEGGVSKVELKARKRSSKSKKKPKDRKETNEEEKTSTVNPSSSEYVNFPKSILSRASRDEEDPIVVTKPSANHSDKMKPRKVERVQSMPKPESSAPSRPSIAWDKDNLKLRKVNMSRSKSTESTRKYTDKDDNKEQGRSMEWRKAIEAKIKSTSKKVKAAAHNAKSNSGTYPGSGPESDGTGSNTRPPTRTAASITSKPPIPFTTRSASPFQANQNSFLSSRRKEPFPHPYSPAHPGSNYKSTLATPVRSRAPPPPPPTASPGIPRTIEQRPLDDDAISGCSSSIADRIKAFEYQGNGKGNSATGNSNGGSSADSDSKQPGMFGRSAPLNSYALSRLRNVTSNVGGLWS